jgi:hypothetical protein
MRDRQEEENKEMVPVSFDAVVRSETRCLPTPREVSTGSIVAFCRRSAETVFGPIVSKKGIE